MQSLLNPFGELTTLAYGGNGRLETQSLSIGLRTQYSTQYSFNALGELTDLANKAGDGSVLSEFGSMLYDAAGNRLSVTANLPVLPGYSGLTQYGYDRRNQLVQEQSGRNGGYGNGFTYDAAGNPTNFHGGSQQFNGNNQNSAFTFDGNGNPISYKGVPLTFDPENRLVSTGH